MIGGIGFLAGPVLGAQLAPGGISEQVLEQIGSGIGRYLPLIGGVALVLLLLANQNGIAKESIAQLAWLRSRLASLLPFLAPRQLPTHDLPSIEQPGTRVPPKTLEVRNLTVTYTGTLAVDDVSLTVKPGEIVGLIGPNGAGKTSLIDAVTGFTARSPGSSLLLDGEEISSWSAVRRSRAGIGRSFQSLELFEDSTVLDNLRAASDPHDVGSYFRDLVWPVNPSLPPTVVSAIREFELEGDLERLVEDLPYGRRRLLALARAVATHASVLLLDEPAAGLGDAETAELAHLVRRLATEWGIAVLLVEHDMNFVMSVCDELVVLDFGRKIAEGTSEAVRRNPDVIAAYLGEPDEAAAAHEQAIGAHTERKVQQ
jgi:sulfate-transporting ATPase